MIDDTDKLQQIHGNDKEHDVHKTWDISERQAMAVMAKINRDRRMNQKRLPDLSGFSASMLRKLHDPKFMFEDDRSLRTGWEDVEDKELQKKLKAKEERQIKEAAKLREKMGLKSQEQLKQEDVNSKQKTARKQHDRERRQAGMKMAKSKVQKMKDKDPFVEEQSYVDPGKWQSKLAAGPTYALAGGVIGSNCASWALDCLRETQKPDVVGKMPGIKEQQDNMDIDVDE